MVPTDHLQESLALVADPELRNELSQVASRVVRSRFGEGTDLRWTYQTRRIVRNITSIQESLLKYASNNRIETGHPSEAAARTVAQAWEYLAELDESVPRRIALINAAIAYDLAGYQANSACLARLAVPTSSWSTEPTVDGAVSAFLQRRFIRLNQLVEQLTVQPGKTDSLSRDELLRKAAQAVLVRSLSTASYYYLRGDPRLLDEAHSYLELATRGFAEVGDMVLANTSTAFKYLLPVMTHRSTWRSLQTTSKSPRWQRYIRVLARGVGQDMLDARSICELWPSQMEALKQGLLQTNDSLVVRMPTSAGKTRIAELLMVYTLVTTPQATCVYVAPYRALVNEIDEAFGSLFSDLGYGANAVHGAYDHDEFGQLIVANDDVLVLTPEKLDLVFRLQPDLLESVALVVIDEGHIVGDQDRGGKFELLISRLRRRLPKARFVILSAVVPDKTLNDFAYWIGEGTRIPITSTWRPAVLQVASLEWSGTTGTLKFVETEDSKFFVPSAIRQRVYEHLYPPTRRIRRPKFPNPASKSEIAAEVGYVFSGQGPVLIFSMQTNWAESIADQVMRRLELTELTGQEVRAEFRHRRGSLSATVASEWLGGTHKLSLLLSRGIAFHHARLPTPVREAIEEDFRSGNMAVLVATSTLAQGVNLPVRTVVFHSTRSQDAEGRPRQLLARDYWNIAGRAGRAGHETTGTAIHIVRNAMDRRDFESYVMRREDVEPVESALYRLLGDLVSERISSEEASRKLDADLLALLVEEDESILETDILEGTLATSLFAIQAEQTSVPVGRLVDVMATSVGSIVERIPSADRRRLYASTGLSSRSCLMISDQIAASGDYVRSLLETASLADVEELTTVLMATLVQVSEMEPRESLNVGEDIVLSRWISGVPVPEIAGEVDGDAQEITRYIEDVYSYRIPWGASGYLRIASSELPGVVLSPTATNIAGIIKYGVPSPEAAWAMTAGIVSRRAAILIATQFVGDIADTSPVAFRKWLANLTPDVLSDEFDLYGSELEMTARAVFRSQVNQYLRRLDDEDDILPLETSVRPRPHAFLDGGVQRLPQGAILGLKRDLDSRLDRNAVMTDYNGVNIGYLPADAAQALAPEMDAGRTMVAKTVTDVAGPSVPIRLRISGA